MKGIIFSLILAIAGSVSFAQETPAKKLFMPKAQWEAYKTARDAKDWAKAEELTVFPDVKAWDAQNQGQEEFSAGNYSDAHSDFVRALKYAVEADKIGRSGTGTNSMTSLRLMIKKAEDAIRSNDANSDDDSK